MTYGKFATAEELLKGYVELEKSFTQKCQQLAVLKEQIAQEKSAQTCQDAATKETEQSKTSPISQDAVMETEQFFENILQTDSFAQNTNDGTSVQTSPSAAEQSTTVDSAVTVPQSGEDASVLDGHATAPVAPTEEQLQQYLQNNPKVVLQLLQQRSEFAPTVMSGGGNVSLAMPSRPKTIKEASLMAKKLFN